MKIIRITLRWFCKTFPIRGRHRIASQIGKFIAPSEKEFIDIDGVSFPIDHSIEMYRYIYYGVYEEHFISLLKRIIKPGDIVIEPGANVGYITAILSSLVGTNGKVISLEPSRICFKMIEKYLKKTNITLLNVAIGDIDGELYFTDKDIVITHGYSAFSSFTSKKANDKEYLISTVTVDTLIEKNQFDNIKLLKLDVEGAELMALKGAKKALEFKKIDYILVETSFGEMKSLKNDEIYNLLDGYGYSCYLMKSNRLISFNYFKQINSRNDVIWTWIRH